MKAQAEHLAVDISDVLRWDRPPERSILEQCLDWFDLEDGLGFQSGRAALRYALLEAGISHDDEVLLPAYSCYAVREAVNSVAEPVYVDVDRDTFSIDLEEAATALTDSTTVIVTTHLYGDCCDMEQVGEFAERNELVVIEDACQALGSALLTDRIGRFADYLVISFNTYKDVTAHSGGVLLSATELPSVSNRLPDRRWQVRLARDTLADRMLRSIPGAIYEQLRRRFLDSKARSASNSIEAMEPGVFGDWTTKVVTRQLERLRTRVEKRREHAAIYGQMLPASVECPRRSDHHAYFRYPVLVPADRRDDICRLLRQRGIGCSKMYAYTLTDRTACPVAADIADRMVNLPVHTDLAAETVEEIAAIVTRVME